MTHIICYMGGSCGDLVGAMFDTSFAKINNSTVRLHDSQSRLKKPHLFASADEKHQYLAESQHLPVIVSHDADYHLTNNHSIITINVDETTALWAAKRFKELHRPHVWQEMTTHSGADTIESYAQQMIDFSSWVSAHSTATINLADILAGDLLDAMSSITEITRSKRNFYYNWLNQQPMSYKQKWKLLRKGVPLGT